MKISYPNFPKVTRKLFIIHNKDEILKAIDSGFTLIEIREEINKCLKSNKASFEMSYTNIQYWAATFTKSHEKPSPYKRIENSKPNQGNSKSQTSETQTENVKSNQKGAEIESKNEPSKEEIKEAKEALKFQDPKKDFGTRTLSAEDLIG